DPGKPLCRLSVQREAGGGRGGELLHFDLNLFGNALRHLAEPDALPLAVCRDELNGAAAVRPTGDACHRCLLLSCTRPGRRRGASPEHRPRPKESASTSIDSGRKEPKVGRRGCGVSSSPSSPPLLAALTSSAAPSGPG